MALRLYLVGLVQSSSTMREGAGPEGVPEFHARCIEFRCLQEELRKGQRDTWCGAEDRGSDFVNPSNKSSRPENSE